MPCVFGRSSLPHDNFHPPIALPSKGIVAPIRVRIRGSRARLSKAELKNAARFQAALADEPTCDRACPRHAGHGDDGDFGQE